jgi:hypothetical protein
MHTFFRKHPGLRSNMQLYMNYWWVNFLKRSTACKRGPCVRTIAEPIGSTNFRGWLFPQPSTNHNGRMGCEDELSMHQSSPHGPVVRGLTFFLHFTLHTLYILSLTERRKARTRTAETGGKRERDCTHSPTHHTLQ